MYKLSINSNSILHPTLGSIPCDPLNTDYQEYLQWVNEGNTPEPADTPPEPPVPTLDELRNAAYVKIDEAAYQTRLKFITPNKDSTYLAKSVQMDAYVAAGYPMDLTNFGYIKAEVARLGGDVAVQEDLTAAANGLVAIRNAWLAVDAIIEETALVAKTSVSKKLKDTTIQAVVDQALIDLGAIGA